MYQSNGFQNYKPQYTERDQRCRTLHAKENSFSYVLPTTNSNLNDQLLIQNQNLHNTNRKLESECTNLKLHINGISQSYQTLKRSYDSEQMRQNQLNLYCQELQQNQNALQTRILDLEQENYQLHQQIEHYKKTLKTQQDLENDKQLITNQQEKLMELSRTIQEEVQYLSNNPLMELLEVWRDRTLKNCTYVSCKLENNTKENNASSRIDEFQIKLLIIIMIIFEDDHEKQQFKQKIDERNQQIQNVTIQQFELDSVFGICDKQINQQLLQVGGNVIFYVSNMIVIQNTLTGKQSFVPGLYKNVTAMSAVPGKKSIFIAVGENLETQSNLVIIKNNKTKTIPIPCKSSISRIEINLERKWCGIQINYSIQIWNYKKERMVAQANVKAAFDKFTFHPLKSKNILLSGPNYLKLWELQSQDKNIRELHDALVPLKIEKENKFLDHGWVILSPTQALLMILGSNNKLFILINEHYKRCIDIDPQNLNFLDAELKDFNVEENDDMIGLNQALEDVIKEKVGNISNQKQTQNTTIISQLASVEFLCLSPTRKGFILGGTKGAVCIFEFDKTQSIINAMSFCMKSQKGEHKVIQLSNAGEQLVSIVSLLGNQLQYSCLSTVQMDTEISPVQPFFAAGFHNKKVNAISHSKIKQLFVTCSEDNSVKIWNYYNAENSEKKGILNKYFKEEPVCAAMHPFGLFVAVGFSSGFKIFALLNEGFFPLKEVSLNSCKILKYSHGGQFLLTNEKSNVVVFDAVYYETIHVFDGHTAPIKDIAISLNDQFVVSTCMNGYVFSFNLQDQQPNLLKEPEHQEPGIYNSIQYNDVFLGSTNDKLLCVFDKKFKLITEFEIIDCYFTKLLLTHNFLICGTNKGAIRIYPIPDEATMKYEIIHNNSNEVRFKMEEPQEIQVHSSPITCLDYDGVYIFSGSQDGSISLVKCEEILTEERQRVAAISNDLYLEEIFKIQKQNDKIQQKNFEVVKSEQTVRIETARLEQDYKKEIDKMNNEFQKVMADDRKMKDTFVEKSEQEYSKLMKQYQEEEQNYEEELKKIDLINEGKIDYEKSRNLAIVEEIEQIKEEQKEKLKQLQIDQKQALKQLKLSFYEKCQKVQVKYSTVVDKAKSYGTSFIQRLEKEEQEYEKEIDEQIKDIENQIAKAIQDNEKLEKENKTLKSQYEYLNKNDEDLQRQLNSLIKEHNQIRHENLKNDEDILKMQHQLLERLQVIDSKEETCKAAKDEKINLENFRYMLDQKIQILEEDKSHLVGKISDKEYKLRIMYNELIEESGKNEQKYQKLVKLKGKLDVIENQVKKSDAKLFLANSKLKQYESTLISIMKSNDAPGVISSKLKAIIDSNDIIDNEDMAQGQVKKNANSQDVKELIKMKQEKPNELNDELLRQGQWMTKKLYLIKLTSDKLKGIRDDNINTIFNQNTKLIEECNMLRSENDKYQKRIKHVEKLLSDTIRLRQRLRSKQQQPKFNQMLQTIDEQNQRLQNQKNKLSNLKDSMSQILKRSIIE